MEDKEEEIKMPDRASLLCCLALALAVPARAAAPELNEGLREAAMKGDAAGVKGFLAKGADVDGASEFGATSLIFAADRGHLEIVKMLLERGADVNRKDTTYQSSPIIWAAYNGHTAVVAFLIEHGSADAADSLGVAIEKGYMDVVKAVLSSGKVPKDSLGPALSAARQQGRSEIAELLVQAGAVPLPSASAVVSQETLATYVGTYHNEGGFELAVSLDGGRLLLSFAGRDPLELSPKEGGLFRIVGAEPTTVSFNVEGGQVTGITVKPPEVGSIFRKAPKTPETKEGKP